MTANLAGHVGEHVQPHDLPTVDWMVDAVIDMHLDHDLIVAHDSDGGRHFLSADEAVFIGRHRQDPKRAARDAATISGVLPHMHMGNPWFTSAADLSGGVQ